MHMQNGHRASNPCNMLLVLAIGVCYVRPRFSAFFILGHSHPCSRYLVLSFFSLPLVIFVFLISPYFLSLASYGFPPLSLTFLSSFVFCLSLLLTLACFTSSLDMMIERACTLYVFVNFLQRQCEGKNMIKILDCMGLSGIVQVTAEMNWWCWWELNGFVSICKEYWSVICPMHLTIKIKRPLCLFKRGFPYGLG